MAKAREPKVFKSMDDDTLVRRVFYCRNIARASNTGRGTRQRGTLDIADGLNTERSF